MRGIDDEIVPARRHGWTGQPRQAAVGEVGRDDLFAGQGSAEAVHRRLQRVGGVAEDVSFVKRHAVHSGGAKPVVPTLAREVADQGQPGNVARLPNIDSAGQRRRGHREQRVIHQMVGGEARPMPGTVPDREVGAAVVEAGQAGFGLHAQTDRGVPGEEFRALLRGAGTGSVRQLELAVASGLDPHMAVRDSTRRGLLRHRVRAVLPADPAHWRQPGCHRHLSGSAVRGGLGLDVAW